MELTFGLLALYEEEWLHVCWNDGFKASTPPGNSVCRQYGCTRAVNVKHQRHL